MNNLQFGLLIFSLSLLFWGGCAVIATKKQSDLGLTFYIGATIGIIITNIFFWAIRAFIS
jgi:hypothetical protein